MLSSPGGRDARPYGFDFKRFEWDFLHSPVFPSLFYLISSLRLAGTSAAFFGRVTVSTPSV